jgi:EAL domain-containing protein (putative c-di-GMP-specific phosphodiesterase class I)
MIGRSAAFLKQNSELDGGSLQSEKSTDRPNVRPGPAMVKENRGYLDIRTMATHAAIDSAAAVLRSGGIRAVYQPLVDLDSGRPVGYETLARGPVGSRLEMPGPLFEAARAEGILGEFDRACREQALAEALRHGLRGEDLLFLNVEPGGLQAEGILDRIAEGGLGQVSVVVELTERALASRPSEVLAAVRWLRERGCRIALDDVGVDPRSLGLMPFVAPDVIKLDRSLTQDLVPEALGARVINAVRAESERSGAVILAEGIETEAHRRRALAMGARLGQGWLFGRPGPLPLDRDDRQGSPDGSRIGPTLPRREPEGHDERTPFERIVDPGSVLIGDKRLLLSLSRQLEQEAFAVQGEAVVLATFQDARFFTERMRRRYERIAASASLVGALGVGVPSRPGVGVRGAGLSPQDRLRGEWDVVVVGPHFAGAFVARDLGDGGTDTERRFEYFMTYERERVTAAAQALLRHLIPDE